MLVGGDVMDELLTKEQFSNIVGKTIYKLRSELGLSQEQFAGNAGLGRTHYGSVERGEKAISAFNLYILLESNGISVSGFFEKI